MTESVRSKSLWLDQYPGSLEPRPGLDGDTQVDVAIVGGGFTGLWSAYYLNKLDPALRVCVIEREVCGFGPSGRNGGWAIGELAGSIEAYAKRSSLDESVRLARAAFDAVDEIKRVCDTEGIDCGYQKGGALRWARNKPQAKRQREEVEHSQSLGFGEDILRLLTPDEARAMGNATDVFGGVHFGPCAALDPARLVRGLSDVVEASGVTIYEQTEATNIEPRKVSTSAGTVTADVIVRATEGYTKGLPGHKRTLIPVYSLMVATEPLPESVFDEIGLGARPTFADDRYMVTYGQRTQDNRIAFGGRSVPYAYGSKISTALEQRRESHDDIASTLVELFPILKDAAITHRWGGVMGAPRNWLPSVHFDRASGLAAGGGYIGEGVAASNLAGRTLAELITGSDSPRTSLAWVRPPERKWEPEPLRWIGVIGSRKLLNWADNYEYKTQSEAKWATKFSKLIRG